MNKDSSGAVDTLVTELDQICRQLPGAEQYVMVHHPAFRVGKKPFAIAGMRAEDDGATVSVNLGHEAQGALLSDERFARTPYIGQHGWVTIPRSALQKGELASLVLDSYRRIANKKQLAALAGELTPSSSPKGAARGRPVAKRARVKKQPDG